MKTKIDLKDLKVVLYDWNPSVLTDVASPITLDDMYEVTAILHWLLNFVKNTNWVVGVALPQVWISKRWFVMHGKDKNGKSFANIIINPEIVEVSSANTTAKEWCLSEPWIEKMVTRPYSVRARFTNWNGKECLKTYTDYAARVFLHEYDHLEGILLSTRQ